MHSMKKILGRFTGQIAQSNEMYTIANCLVGSKSKSKPVAIESNAFEGQITPSNKMFTISKYSIGSKSQSKPVPVSSVQSERIRDKAGRFHVLILGRANAGKTTILQKVCNTTEEPDIFDTEGNKVQSRSTKIGIEAMILTKYCSSSSDRHIS